ncbi:cold-shock protein [Amorphus sp. MBR-141]|jgi:CspA family cold shock protein
MTIGSVKFYNATRGYGFIAPEDGGQDVFVHATALQEAGMSDLVEGQKVSFNVRENGSNGKLAAADLQSA